MDAARARPATSGRRRHVTRHRVVVGEQVSIVEDDVPLEEEEWWSEFRNPSVPYLPELNHRFPAGGAGSRRGAAEEADRNCKRACVPASSKAVLGLQEVSAGDTKTQAECAVCLQDFGAEDKLRAMPCAHAFHQDCIFRWLRVNHVCPLCRRALLTQQPEDDDDDDEETYRPASMPVPEEA